LYAVDLTDARPRVTEVARDLACPNGMVITPDRSTLIVAETYRSRLTAFERDEDGTLRNRRVLACFDGGQPDGLALDRAGGIWAGLPYASEFVRVGPDGSVTDRIGVPGEWAVGCGLGGPDRTSLYMAVCVTSMPELQAGRSRGRILVAPVAVPGAGWP
jgi:sugar lactone lactonase YvrE